MAPVEDAFFPTITDVHAHEATGDRRKNVNTTAATSLLKCANMLHIRLHPPGMVRTFCPLAAGKALKLMKTIIPPSALKEKA
jgi:hypothetical protein